jgi:poly(A) polymerase Pap1
LSKIITASVPIISFDFKGTPIDISFSQLNQEIVPRDIEKNLSAELINSIIDEKCKLSLLGRKNNVMIKESVPNQ